MTSVPMTLRRIIINELKDQQLVELRELDGDRSFKIVIGLFEATAINRRVKNVQAARPLTHDLIVQIVEGLGGELQDVVVSDLRDHIYYSVIRVQLNGELLEIDSRPSDAIAIAVTADIPIYVDEHVISAGSLE